MTTQANPKVNAPLSGAQLPVQNTAQKILILGQMTSAATATSGELQLDVGSNQEGTLFGPPSQLANAIEAGKLINEVNPWDAIGLDDPAGVAATATITFTAAAATEAGTLTFAFGEKRNGQFDLPVAIGDDEDALSAALTALIQAKEKCLVSAVSALNVTTVTAENVGLIGNNYPISVSGSVGGVAVAITAMSGGTLAPTLTNVFDVIGDTRYQTIIWPAEWGTTTVKTLLDARFNVYNKILDGVAVMVAVDTKSNLETLGAANNSQSIVIESEKPESTSTYKGPSTFDSPLSEAAIVGAIRALRLSAGAQIADYVIAPGALDKIGGPAIASLPYFNTGPLPLPVQLTGAGWTSTQGGDIDDLEDAGLSTLGKNTAGTAMILGPTLTTYKTDAAGKADASWKYLNYVDTASQCREFMFNNVKADTGQHRNTDGNLEAGRSMHNIESVTNLFIGYYGTLSGPDYVLLRSGEANLIFFRDNLTVTQDLATGSFTVTCILPIVTQVREINIPISLSFTAN